MANAGQAARMRAKERQRKASGGRGGEGEKEVGREGRKEGGRMRERESPTVTKTKATVEFNIYVHMNTHKLTYRHIHT